MEKHIVEEYIKKLQDLEKIISESNLDDDLENPELDDEFISELNDVLGKIARDVEIDMGGSGKTGSSVLEVKVKKLRDDAVIPTYSKDGDAGMDLTSTHIIKSNKSYITYGTGIAIEIPMGYVGLVFPRSSIKGVCLTLSNSVGVIDSGYRGEIQCSFRRTIEDTEHCLTQYHIGERVAQLVIIPYPNIKFIESDTLSDTDRSDGGFGYTGR